MEWIWVVVLGVPVALAVGAAHRRRGRQLRTGAVSPRSRWAPYSTDYQAAYLVHGGDGARGTARSAATGDAGTAADRAD